MGLTALLQILAGIAQEVICAGERVATAAAPTAWLPIEIPGRIFSTWMNQLAIPVRSATQRANCIWSASVGLIADFG